MALETGTYIQDLVTTNPTGSDFKNQGDDHLRLVKTLVKATFPNADREFRFPSTETATVGNLTVDASDAGRILPVSALAANRTVSLPAGSGLYDGWSCKVVKADHSNFQITIDPDGSETVNGESAILLYQRYQFITLTWSVGLSGWLAERQPIPPIGFIAPFIGATTAPTGWLFPNGQTIGNGASGGTARGNEDCRGLFYFLYNNWANAQAAVSGGRGASAQADFDANKTIALPNFAGRVPVGSDILGGISDAGVLDVANNTGLTFGSQYHTLLKAELPAEGVTFTTDEEDEHTHGYLRPLAGTGGDGGAAVFEGSTAATTDPGSAHVHTGTTDNLGSGTPHNNMQPSIVTGYLIKL